MPRRMSRSVLVQYGYLAAIVSSHRSLGGSFSTLQSVCIARSNVIAFLNIDGRRADADLLGNLGNRQITLDPGGHSSPGSANAWRPLPVPSVELPVVTKSIPPRRVAAELTELGIGNCFRGWPVRVS